MTKSTLLGVDTAAIIAAGEALGLDRVGVCTTEPFTEVRRTLIERRRRGLSDRLSFTFTDPDRSTDVRRSHPWAERLVVAGRAYLPEAGNPGPPRPRSGRIARFSTDDHYRPLVDALEGLATLLGEGGWRAEILVDDNRLVDRAAAVRAGIGWWGKNTMVLAPGQGPWMLLGSIVTDAELEVTEPSSRSCGTCSACLPACPTGALIAPGVLDARRCIAALLQQRGSIPIEIREAVGDRIYGCDDCLDACPPGVRAVERTEVVAGRVDLHELIEMPDDELDRRFDRFYVPGRKMRFLRRNLIVALGNAGDRSSLPLLERFLESDDPLLASHAIWAIGRIGGPLALSMLSELDPASLEPEARSDLQSALAGLEAPIGK